jgi:predicted outer membrane protein
MARSIRRALTLGSLALAVLACRHEGQQGPIAPEAAPTSTAPTLAAVDVPVGVGGATSAPLPPAPTGEPNAAEPGPQDSLRERAPLSDEQIVAVSSAADRAALDQAKVARDKARDGNVKKLAERLATEHGELEKNRGELVVRLGVKAAPSSLSDELTTDAVSSLATLKKAGPADFDAVYLDAQIRSHQRLLELFDTQLIGSAKNVDLKHFLQDARARTQAQLELATELHKARAPKPSTEKSK